MDTAAIPLNDLKPKLSRLGDRYRAAYSAVIDSGWLVLGPEVETFESSYAAAVGVDHCVGVASGTDALELCLRTVSTGPVSVVATVANAGGYATTAILAAGATPLYIDVDPDTAVVTPSEVQRALAAGVDAVVVTHLYGRLVPDIMQIASDCRESGVALIEDCAQAHGACSPDGVAGSFGHASAFSFYPTKNLGALGDGGAVCSNDPDIADRVRSLRQYGWSTKYETTHPGGRNSRLDELQAAFLNVALPDLAEDNNARRHICRSYAEQISHPAVRVLPVDGSEHVGHLAVVAVERNRNSLQRHLRANGVLTDVHYPVADHRQPFFGDRFTAIDLPGTERLTRQVLSLPCHPYLEELSIKRVAELVNDWIPDPEVG